MLGISSQKTCRDIRHVLGCHWRTKYSADWMHGRSYRLYASLLYHNPEQSDPGKETNISVVFEDQQIERAAENVGMQLASFINFKTQDSNFRCQRVLRNTLSLRSRIYRNPSL